MIGRGRWTRSLAAGALCLRLGAPVAVAAEAMLPPTDLGAEIALPEIQPADARTITLDRITALGIVAFNSPYLFGGRALHDGLTCSSCHGVHGLSGPATRITFDRPVPDLHPRSPSPAPTTEARLREFIVRAIMTEFDGPRPGEDILGATAAYLAQLPPRAAGGAAGGTADGAAGGRRFLGPLDIVLLATDLLDDPATRSDPDRRVFLIETARFALGQIARSGRAETPVTEAELAAWNQRLKAIDALASTADTGDAVGEIDALRRTVSERLDRTGRAGLRLAPKT